MKTLLVDFGAPQNSKWWNCFFVLGHNNDETVLWTNLLSKIVGFLLSCFVCNLAQYERPLVVYYLSRAQIVEY